MIKIFSRLLDEINGYFTKILNEKIFREDPEDFLEHVRKCLKLNNESDWNYIIACKEILDDSNSAIKNFLSFGLGGPTKIDTLGEKYLRLYGLLNASYLQQQSLKNLVKLFQLSQLREYTQKIDGLDIRRLRNQIGAHSVDYHDKYEGVLKAFVPVRMTMTDFLIDCFEHTKNDYHELDLKALIEDHLKLMCRIYTEVIAKAIRTIYKSNSQKIEEVMEPVEAFEAMLSGSALISVRGDYEYILMTPV